MNSEILAMIIASITAGVTAYFVSCRFRQKIVIASALAIIFGIVYIIIKTNFQLLTSNRATLDAVALGLGAMGIYLLALCFFLIPLGLISWYITYQIRNVKEQKDPLLILEGRCDL
jgi:hypothetical protein